MAKQVWVSPASSTQWHKRVVQQPDNNRASARTYTKTEALTIATQIAKNQWLELKVQNRNGRISESNSYGHDPRSIHG